MFRIGEFSRIARVSCRLLRYYDQLGLFTPRITSSRSGYRYYEAAQLADLNRILVLRDLGLTLEQIKGVVDDELSASELRAMLLVRRSEAEQRVAEESERLRRIELRIAELEAGGGLPTDDIVFRSEPALRIVSLRRTMSGFDDARAWIAALVEAAPRHTSPSTLGRLLVIVHSPEFEPQAIDAEVGYILGGTADVEIPVRDTIARTRVVDPVETMAVCVRDGPPEDAHRVTGAIGRRIEADGYALTGPNRELFLGDRESSARGSAVVEMQFEVTRIATVRP